MKHEDYYNQIYIYFLCISTEHSDCVTAQQRQQRHPFPRLKYQGQALRFFSSEVYQALPSVSALSQMSLS